MGAHTKKFKFKHLELNRVWLFSHPKTKIVQALPYRVKMQGSDDVIFNLKCVNLRFLMIYVTVILKNQAVLLASLPIKSTIPA